jgi:hypothetical protein
MKIKLFEKQRDKKVKQFIQISMMFNNKVDFICNLFKYVRKKIKSNKWKHLYLYLIFYSIYLYTLRLSELKKCNIFILFLIKTPHFSFCNEPYWSPPV